MNAKAWTLNCQQLVNPCLWQTVQICAEKNQGVLIFRGIQHDVIVNSQHRLLALKVGSLRPRQDFLKFQMPHSTMHGWEI